MKNVPSFKHLIFAAAVSLGFSAAAVAQARDVAGSDAAGAPASGLLGKDYLSLAYEYNNLHGTNATVRDYSIGFNESVREGLDAYFNYSYGRSSKVLARRTTAHDFAIGGRAFLAYGGMKPFVDADLGWAFLRRAARDDSFTWGVGAGVEFDLGRSFSVTPFVRFTDAPHFRGSETWTYGAKANYWVTPKVGVSVGVNRDDDRNTGWNLATNIRY